MRAGIAGVFEAIAKEREWQDQKYGPVLDFPRDGIGEMLQGPGGHELGTWLVILEKELEEAKTALVHGGSKAKQGRDTIRAELVQIAAVAVAALEQHGLQEEDAGELQYVCNCSSTSTMCGKNDRKYVGKCCRRIP